MSSNYFTKYEGVSYGDTGSGLDQIVDTIALDFGLSGSVSSADLAMGVEAANRMNAIIIEAIEATGVGGTEGVFTSIDVYKLNAYIRANHAVEWMQLHGDDEEDYETGYHLVQNDGAATKFGGDNLANTVADGLYHLGWPIVDDHLLNEDGDKNESVSQIAEWLTLLYTDRSDTNTGLDRITDLIIADANLPDEIFYAEIAEGAAAANAMNTILLEAITNTGVMSDKWITADDVRQLNSYIRTNYMDEWMALHGDDEKHDGEYMETGFHLVQNDGANTKMFGKNFVNTVADGIYHLGFEIEGDRLLNEDGNKNAYLSDIADWLNYFLVDQSTTGTGLDQLVDAVKCDHGLARNTCAADIAEGADAANEMNKILIEAINATTVAADNVISPEDIVAINEYIRTNYMYEWDMLHGDDDSYTGEETGFHLVQNDGSAINFRGENLINTVIDGIYHLGYEIYGDYVLNEDGDKNASLGELATWLNHFYLGESKIFGSMDGDKLKGLNSNDEIQARGGDDRVYAYGGDDFVDGGAGNDTLYGGMGKDTLHGGEGKDYLKGNQGNDTLYGGTGNDYLYGHEGFDILEGGDGDDYLEGGDHIDKLKGGAGNDRLYGNSGIGLLDGGAGDDYLKGGDERDLMLGGAGNDTFYGYGGNDILAGQDGNDCIKGDGGDDRLIGGLGADKLYGGDGVDILTGGQGADKLYGGTGDDNLDGGADDDYLSGEEGADVLIGAGGNDNLRGGAGDDYLEGGVGNDSLNGDDGVDLVLGGEGDDTLSGGNGNDELVGSVGNDKLYGDAGDDLLDGGEGSDYLKGGDGKDTLLGGVGDDKLYGSGGDDLLDGGDGADYMQGNDGYDTLSGGAGDDTLYGGNQDDILSGGSGNDTLIGDAGNDHLSGDAGDDTLKGYDDNDVLDGGDGNDRLYGGNGADVIVDGNGVDELQGGAGNDRLYALADNANDRLRGNDGADTFLFQAEGAGVGADRVDYFNRTEGDKLVIGGADVAYELQELSSSHTLVTLTTTGGSALGTVDVYGDFTADDISIDANAFDGISSTSVIDIA